MKKVNFFGFSRIFKIFTVEKAFEEIPDLRARAVEHMLKRLQIGFSLFTDCICLIKDHKDDCKIQSFYSKLNIQSFSL